MLGLGIARDLTMRYLVPIRYVSQFYMVLQFDTVILLRFNVQVYCSHMSTAEGQERA